MVVRFLLNFLLFSVCAYPQTLTCRSLSADDGLLEGTICYVLQDSKGYIWFGTKNGVVRWIVKSLRYLPLKMASSGMLKSSAPCSIKLSVSGESMRRVVPRTG